MQTVDASEAAKVEVRVGETVQVTSPRRTVVPPYPMLQAFVEAPANVLVERQDPLDYEGAYGAVFSLRATGKGMGTLTVGLRDLKTDEVTERRQIHFIAR